MESAADERDLLNPKLTRRGAWIGAGILFVLAFGLRLGGIGWGLPNENRYQSLHPDEELIYLVGTQTPYLRPGFYNYGTLYFTLIHLANDAGMSYGWIPVGDDVPMWQTQRAGTETGRIVTALSGAATVSLVFATLLLVTGSFGSFIGAVAMLLAPGHLVHSRFQTTDVFATMLIALAAFLLIRAVSAEQTLSWKKIVALGVVVGLAAGTKYTGAILLLPALFVLFARGVGLKNCALLLGSSIVGFLIATPGALLETEAFLRGVTYEMGHTAAGHGLVFVGTPSGFIYQFWNSAEAFGFAPLLLGCAGLVWAAISKKRWGIAVVIFFIAYYVVIGTAEVKFLRYVFPLLPFLALGLGYLAGRCHEEKGWKRIVTGLTILLVGVTSTTTAGALVLTRLMSMQDPRDEAALWLENETPGHTTIGLVSDPWFYSPPLFPNIGLLSPSARLDAMGKNPRIVRYIAPDGDKKDWDVRLLDHPPNYIVFSSFEFLDHDRLSEPNFVAFIERMPTLYTLVGIFWGPEPAFAKSDRGTEFTRDMLRVIMRERYPKTHDMMYIRPTLCVFKLKNPN